MTEITPTLWRALCWHGRPPADIGAIDSTWVEHVLKGIVEARYPELHPALEALTPAELDGITYDYRDRVHTAYCDAMQAANDY
jgi:hypothetical protein